MKRLEQLRDVTRNGRLKELFKTKEGETVTVVEYNLQRNELFNVLTSKRLSSDDPMTNPLKEIDNMTLSQNVRTIAIIEYVFTQAHADALSDWMAAWSQDTRLYTNKSTIIIFCSSSELFNETLRRLCYSISITPSVPEEREELMKKNAKEIKEGFQQKYKENIDLEITSDLVQASGGLNLHETETAELQSFFTDRKITVDAFTEFKVKILKEAGMEFIQPKIKFPLVGGEELLKAYVVDNVITLLRNPEIATKYGIGIPKGMIIAGIPGTGKDHFVEAVAGELELAMIKLTPADFFRGIVGQSESQVKRVFNVIESLGKVVVYIPEIDQLFLKRGLAMMTDSGVQRRIQDMMLDRLGKRDREYFLMGSTNFIDQIDPASIRPGRVDEVVLQMPPNQHARKEICIIHTTKLRQMPIAADMDFDHVADETFGWTPAELEKLCLTAGRIAMKERAKKITAAHFESALGTIEINMGQRGKRIQDMITAMKGLDVVSKQFLEQSIDSFKQTETEKDKTRVQAFLSDL